MKIVKVEIPTQYDDNGIQDIRMNRLGNLVLLAGKNGAGKSRVLEKIQMVARKKPNKEALVAAQKTNRELTDAIRDHKREIVRMQGLIVLTKDENEKEEYARIIENSQNNITSWENEILKRVDPVLNYNYVETDPQFVTCEVVNFVPDDSTLNDSNDYSKHELHKQADKVSTVGMQNLSAGAIAKIQVIQDRYYNARHPDLVITQEEKEQAEKDYLKLTTAIKLFLNTDLGRSIDGDVLLFGFPIGKAKLSAGQRILLKFCLAIYSQETSIKDIILFLDEPENHLHPSVAIDIIDKLRAVVTNGQIWIATHSISILAHFDPSLIWYIDNNTISYAGNIPEKVLESLLGDESEISRLQDFIGLPSQYAINRFSFECLFNPKAVMTGEDDSQTLQIKSELRDLLKVKNLKLLDFGAGKGRLLSNILSSVDEPLANFNNTLEYVAFDPSTEDKDECVKIIAQLYDDVSEKYFNDSNVLLSAHDSNSFDIIVMCNVLHEIDPIEWLNIFSSESVVMKLLKDDGVILIVEDLQMPIGEKAYQKGFIVLDTPQIKELFKITKADESIGYKVTDARGDGRLKAHRIPKKCLQRISASTRLSALKSLKNRAHSKILITREQSVNYKNGKVHALWVQQFANTSIAISEIEGNGD